MWFYFWKGTLNLGLEEYMLLTPGMLRDLISCYQIAHGIADEGESDEKYIPDLR